ncbi:palmitoyltransferase-2 [Coleophoma crateriformis]|uniref:Palmitoyltransferase n=1 Tax=Coleophoma crateriformis TaxID=565419 RepID=A0A3D8T8T9_9HELO|nr:palmitoyltransferase-2 [Coleophoma crateriformis]
MPRKWARKVERYCCLGVTYFPLAFVYSITTWAAWVEATIGFLPSKSSWIGNGSSFLGIALYLLLNWSYTTAVFTDPGTTTSWSNGYSSLPMQAPPAATNFTVKSNGELRYCKKCQARKPDRAHHCSTCRKCVLKMDHHCPWLATCVGLRNYKAFLLFLIYTTLFCFLDFAVSATWVWREILNDGEYSESLMPVNYVMLAVISGIIGIVLAGFTGWHILLASRGQTTIECLEKTRYLSPVRKAMKHQHIASYDSENHESPDYGQQLQTMRSHAPEARPEDTEIPFGQTRQYNPSYDEIERERARARYEEYLDEVDSEKLPSAFDLGRQRNLAHLFGPRKLLWFFPICTTTGDGWSWEPSPKWLAAREMIAREREEQRDRERAAGWGEPSPALPPAPQAGAGRHYLDARPTATRSTSKADRILGRDPTLYADEGSSGRPSSAVSMRTMNRVDLEDDEYDISSDEDEADRKLLDRKAAAGWPQKMGVFTNTLLGNTLARKKDDVRGWDGIDDDVD